MDHAKLMDGMPSYARSGIAVGSDLPPAVILNLHESGLALARSLGKHGVRVIGLTADHKAPGIGSKFMACRRSPDSRQQPEALLKNLHTLAREFEQRAVLFPTNDADLEFMRRFRGELESGYVPALAPPDVLDIVRDKARLALEAQRHSFPTPATRHVRSPAELEECLTQFVFPVVIKPVDTNDWRTPEFLACFGPRKGWRVETPAECIKTFGAISAVCPSALVQEWIEGPEDGYFIVGTVIGTDGRPLGAFSGQKLMQYPPGIGLGCVLQSTEDASLVQDALALLRSLRFTGMCEVEYKLDTRKQERLLVEINPRAWDQHGLAQRLGLDLPWLYYCDLIGHPIPSDLATPNGSAVWIRSGGVLRGIKEAIRTGNVKVFLTLLAVLPMPKCWSIWTPDDPSPTLLRFGIGKNRALLDITGKPES